MSRRLENAIRLFDRSKADKSERIAGLLGITTGGEQVVEIPNRPGYVWVRLRANVNEIIQAFNETTSPVYGLPVFVERDPLNNNRYRVVSRDVGLYADWGTASPFLANHAISHSFVEGGGADVTWIYGRQFMPGNVAPSGTFGAGNVIVHPYPYFFADNWHYAGGTGSADLLSSKPSSANARIVLIYLDATDGNPKLIEGSEFTASITGSAAIIPYVPALGDPNTQIPLAAVRLVSGTSAIRWSNIYDLKPYYSVAATGSAGGGGSSGLVYVSGDDTTLGYLENKLAAGTGIELTVTDPGGNESITITNTGDTGPTGSSTFLGLNDTPSSYSGQALRATRVNAAQDALEFADFPIGPTGTVKVSTNDTVDDFLENKIVAGSNVTISVLSEGGDEQLSIASTGGGGGGGAGTAFSGARKYRTATQSIPQNSWTDVSFLETVSEFNYDTDNYFATGTTGGQIEIPEEGYYHILGMMRLQGVPTGTYAQLGLWLNGTQDVIANERTGYYDDGDLDRTFIVATDYYLTDTDDVKLRIFTSAADGVVTSTGTANAYFQIHRISPPDTFRGARVHRTSNQSINDATGTSVAYETEAYDVEADFVDLVTNDDRVTFPTGGYYHLVGQVAWENSTNGYRRVMLYRNGPTGTIIAEHQNEPVASGDRHMIVATDYYFNQGDYVEMRVWHNHGSSTTIRENAGESDGGNVYLVTHYLGA